MIKLKTLDDLFYHELRDLYSAELQLIDAIPEMIDAVSNTDLKKAFEHHLKETRQHKDRLEEISSVLNVSIEGRSCKSMKGLISEMNSFIAQDAEASIKDAGVIANAQRVEHFEISAYGSAIAHAKQIGLNGIADRLSATLEQEKSADLKLTTLAKNQVIHDVKL